MVMRCPMWSPIIDLAVQSAGCLALQYFEQHFQRDDAHASLLFDNPINAYGLEPAISSLDRRTHSQRSPWVRIKYLKAGLQSNQVPPFQQHPSGEMRPFTLLSAVVSVVSASPYPIHSARNTGVPTVKLDLATVTGISPNSSATEQFLGIPFAQPP